MSFKGGRGHGERYILVDYPQKQTIPVHFEGAVHFLMQHPGRIQNGSIFLYHEKR
jgi:hypothetical protein